MPQEMHYKNAILENSFEWFHYNSPPEDITMHEHDFHEIYIFLKGDIKFQLKGSIYTLLPGDIVLVPSSMLHTPLFLNQKPYERIVIWVKKDYINSLSTSQTNLNMCFESENTHLLLRHNTKKAQQICDYFKNVNEEDFGADLHWQILLLDLLLYFSESKQDGKKFSKATQRFDDLIIYINAHLQEELSIEVLSEQCNISKSYLLRDFKKVYGVTLHQYIIKERLAEAKLLLRNGVPASDVSTLCGFTDYSGFLLAFKKLYEVTPTKFCKLMKIGELYNESR